MARETRIPPQNVAIVGKRRLASIAWYSWFQTLILSVSATLADITAAVAVETSARVAADAALATADTTLTASFNTISASALISMATSSTAAGADASIAIRVRASTGASFTEAGIYLDALTGGLTSRIRLVASQINLNGIILDAGGVITGFIADNAVTTGLTLSNPSITDPSPGSGTEFQIASGTYTSSGETVLVQLQSTLTNSVWPGEACIVRLYRNGSWVTEWAIQVTSFGGSTIKDAYVGPESMFWYIVSGAGSDTWAVKAEDQTIGGAFTFTDTVLIVKDWQK